MRRWFLLFAILLIPFFGANPYSPMGNRLFTLGTVVLENVTQAHMLSHDHASFGATTFDVNGDGWPDLLVSNHGQPPTLFINHQAGAFTPAPQIFHAGGLDHHTPVLADFDNDGDQDLYFLLGAHLGTGIKENEFYINQGKGKPFVLSQNAGITDPKGRGRGAVWFDYDQDGLIDLLVLNKYRADASNRLYHNNGNGTFSDASAGSGLDLYIDSEGGGVAGDIDNDGDMDVMVTSTTHRSYLFINQGDGTFRDETQQRGISLIGEMWGVGMADYNQDGFLDLYLTRGVPLRLEGALLDLDRLAFMQSVRNPDDKTDLLTFQAPADAVLTFQFSDFEVDPKTIYVGANSVVPPSLDFKLGPGQMNPVGKPSLWKDDGSTKGTFIWKDSTSGLWNIAAGAGNENAYWSGGLVVSSSSLQNLEMVSMEPAHRSFGNFFYVNKGDGTFLNKTQEAHLESVYNNRSAIWADFDNDSDLDLFVVSAGFNGPGKQPNLLFVNDKGVFQKYEVPMGKHEQFAEGDGGLTFDFNRDGLMDLFTLNGEGQLPGSLGPYQLFQNRTQNNNRWIEFRMQGAGRDYTNRDGVGAKIRLTTKEGQTQWRYALGGAGSDCQSSRALHFGLGSATAADIEVIWPPSHTYPQGHTQSFSFNTSQLNQRYVLHELNGIL